jgi:hypothetical protein
MSGGNVPVNHSLDGDWDAGGTRPMVYCDRCKHFRVPNKIKYCVNPKSEVKELDAGPINRLNSDIYFDPTVKNANHDCKDYEGK